VKNTGNPSSIRIARDAKKNIGDKIIKRERAKSLENI
jgi:hypothetical protein